MSVVNQIVTCRDIESVGLWRGYELCIQEVFAESRSGESHAARFYEAYTSTAFGKLERILAAHGYDVRDMPQFQYLRPYD